MKVDPSIVKKMHFKENSSITVLNSPDGFVDEFGKSIGPISSKIVQGGRTDRFLVFVYNKDEIRKYGSSTIEKAGPNTRVWFAYPKKSSGIKTDITRDSGWEPITDKGWRGVAMISIDDTWSAFRVRLAESLSSKLQPKPVSDKAVADRTGRKWEEWYKTLDDDGCKDHSHKEIVMILADRYSLDRWWAQMVTNAYEQYLGHRQKHQKDDGFEISASKTLTGSLPNAFEAFINPGQRADWMPDPDFIITTSTENKSLRAMWVDQKTRISVNFYPNGEDKTQVVIQHMKLPTTKEGEKMKTYWRNALGNLSRIIHK